MPNLCARCEGKAGHDPHEKCDGSVTWNGMEVMIDPMLGPNEFRFDPPLRVRPVDYRYDMISPVVIGEEPYERAHQEARWHRVCARWRAKGWWWFIDWSAGPEVRSFARVAHLSEPQRLPLTIEQMLDFWRKYCTERE